MLREKKRVLDRPRFIKVEEDDEGITVHIGRRRLIELHFKRIKKE